MARRVGGKKKGGGGYVYTSTIGEGGGDEGKGNGRRVYFLREI